MFYISPDGGTYKTFHIDYVRPLRVPCAGLPIDAKDGSMMIVADLIHGKGKVQGEQCESVFNRSNNIKDNLAYIPG